MRSTDRIPVPEMQEHCHFTPDSTASLAASRFCQSMLSLTVRLIFLIFPPTAGANRSLCLFCRNAGSFVLYDVTKDQWQIYNEKLSTRRVSPDSTFKIYSGLFALEEGLIAPESSGREWNGTAYPFESWNQDQTLATAMQNSVNWYFQDLDQQMGISALYSYYRQVSYGNCDLSSGTDQYWAEASLKISPAEQVLLLSGLLQNRWGI